MAKLPLIIISTFFITVKSGDVRNAFSQGTKSYVESIQANEGAGGSSNFRDSGKYSPVSEINQFELGYGNTYYRLGDGNSQNSNNGVSNNGPGSQPSGSQNYAVSGFDRPLDVFTPNFDNTHLGPGGISLGGALTLAGQTGNVQAQQLLNQLTRTLAKLNSYGVPQARLNYAAAALAGNPALIDAVDANLEGKLYNKGVRLENLEREKQALIQAAGHAAIGSIHDKNKLGHAFSHGAGLGYGLNPIHSALNARLEGKLYDKGVKFEELEREQQELIRLAGQTSLEAHHEKKKLAQAGISNNAYGAPGRHVKPLLGKLEAVDSHLQGKLFNKGLRIEQLEHEKQDLINAAGQAALKSLHEKNNFAHVGVPAVTYGPGLLHYGSKAALLNPLLGRLQAVDENLEGKLFDKGVRLEKLEKERQHLIQAAGQVSIGSIYEKEKLAHVAGLANSYGVKPHLKPLLGKLEAVNAHFEGKLFDKGSRLEELENERQELIHSAGKISLASIQEKDKLTNLYSEGLRNLPIAAAAAADLGFGYYNSQFSPVNSNQAPLKPVNVFESYNPGAGFGGDGDVFGAAPFQQEIIHPIYPKQSLQAQKIHNILVEEVRDGQNYYDPAISSGYGPPGHQFQQPGSYSEERDISVIPSKGQYAVQFIPEAKFNGQSYNSGGYGSQALYG